MARRKRLNDLVVRILGNSTDLEKKLNRADAALLRIQKTAKRVAIAFAAVTAVAVGVGHKMFEVGAQAAETQSKFETVFGGMSDSMQAWLDDFGTMAGLSKERGQAIVAQTGAIAQGFGFTTKRSAELAQEITKLSADLASFHNLQGGTEEASLAVINALAGEREQIKKLGIVLREEDVTRRALLETGKKRVSDLTQQERVTASLHLITEKAGVAVGDLARTQDSAANRARQLRARLDSQVQTLSLRMLPALEALLPIFDRLISKSEVWAEKLANAFETIGDMAGLTDPTLRAEMDFIKTAGDDVERLTRRMIQNEQEVQRLRGRIGELYEGNEWFYDAGNTSEAMSEAQRELEALLQANELIKGKIVALWREPMGTGDGGAGAGGGPAAGFQEMIRAQAELLESGQDWALYQQYLGLVAEKVEVLKAGHRELSERRVPRLKTAIVDAAEAARNTAVDVFDAFADSAASATQEGLGSFKRFFQQVTSMLVRLAAKFAIFSALNAFLPGGSGIVSALGSAWGFGGAPTRHLGGPVTAGNLYRIRPNEEVFQPAMDGSVIPFRNQQAAQGGGTTVQFVLDTSRMPAPTNPFDVARDSQWIEFLSRSIREWQRNGGRLQGQGA